jgi:hypothetical protein
MLVTRHKLCYYNSLFRITEKREGSIFKTEFLGHIHEEDPRFQEFATSESYFLGSVSTSYSSQDQDLIKLPMYFERKEFMP